MPDRLHGDAAVFDRLGARRMRKVIDAYGVHHVPGIVQSEVPFLVAGESHPLILSRKNSNNNILVPLVVNRLPHTLEKLAVFVQDEKIIRRDPGLAQSSYGQFIKARPFRLFGLTVVIFRQSLPSFLSVSRSILRPLAFEILDVVGGTGRGKKQNTPEILVRLFSYPLGNDVERRGVTGA